MFCYYKSQAAYREAMTGKYGVDETQWPLMDTDVWQQCAASSKGRVYGFGSMSNPNVVLSQSSPSTGRSSANPSAYTTNEEVRLFFYCPIIIIS